MGRRCSICRYPQRDFDQRLVIARQDEVHCGAAGQPLEPHLGRKHVGFPAISEAAGRDRLPRNVHENQISAPRRASSGGIDFGSSFRTQDHFTEWLIVPVKP